MQNSFARATGEHKAPTHQQTAARSHKPEQSSAK